jgi:nicotinate-nucleotide adenylyltransferase
LCFGGSFNPIHNGHLICSLAAARACGFGSVVLIPSSQPPHKPRDSELADPEHRLAMVQLAANYQNHRDLDVRFEVDEIELQRTGPSYTIDTALELKRRGWDQVNWLIGADMLNYLPKWHDTDSLLREVRFVILARPGVEIRWDALPAQFQHLRQNLVPAPLVDVSASEIRRRVREGQNIDELTVPPVVDYIRHRRLYL